MEKCSNCSKEFPKSTLKKMIQIIGQKAYIKQICPFCQAIVLNNPNYYYLVEEEKQ